MSRQETKLIHVLQYIAVRSVVALIGALGGRISKSMGRRLGGFAWSVVGFRRDLVMESMSAAFPDKDRRELFSLGRECYRNLGAVFVEMFLIHRISDSELAAKVTFRNREVLEGALDEGNGVVNVAFHYGNWELGAAVIARRVPLTAMVRPMKNPLADRLINARRAVGGLQVMGHRDSARKIVQKLSRGEAVGILLDQSASRRESVFTPFLGRPTSVNFGLALLAARTGAPVLPVFPVREGDGRHVVRIGERVELIDLPDRQEVLGMNTARITAVLEEHIHRYPEQWFWVHNRWKNAPEAGERVYRL